MLKNFILNNTSLPSFAKVLDVYALRGKVISTNIANIGTPGYKRLNVNFEEKLRSSVVNSIQNSRTHEKHFAIGKSNSISNTNPKIDVDTSKDLKSGMNNVSIEEEMVELAKNQIRYMYATRMASRSFASIRASIRGRA